MRQSMEANMQVEPKSSSVRLAKEGLLAIRDGRSTRVLCENGSLWITQEGDSRDAVISAGESFTIRHQGLTILTALEPSQLTIVEPAPAKTPVRPARAATEAASCA